MRALRSVFYVVALPAALVALWWLLTLGSDSFWVPRPGELVSTFREVWIGPRFMDDVVPSLTRLAVGLVLAIALGILGGLAIGSSRVLRRLSEPVLEFFRAIPPPVLVPILMVLVGVNDTMKVLVIVSGAVWPVLLNTIEGVRGIDEVLSDTAKSYGIHGTSRITMLTLPAASPNFMTGIRQALSIGLILMVISEMFASSSGLGFTIVQFQRSFAVTEMWSGIVLLGLIGVLLAGIYSFVERRVLRWYHGLKEVEQSE
ncbi:ABC transporter permease [Ornithinimicrobium tianjinense]|uniref:Nitrate ABC transporter permease n=1 Tax=Ornithinimicrobium tianjinense TaxID=1195761 RepID=A0A917F235_9MICO|nr:ABC transporter permease [Ornithinimicrobium tianjinense]GGF40776.1 nitrate ABC transporter permease [Ornithinimicrobium tianjinense]